MSIKQNTPSKIEWFWESSVSVQSPNDTKSLVEANGMRKGEEHD